MHTRAKQKHVASDRARRENVPGTFFLLPKIRREITWCNLGKSCKNGAENNMIGKSAVKPLEKQMEQINRDALFCDETELPLSFGGRCR